MTAIAKTQAISDLCAAGLPALLATAGLDDFDAYRNETPHSSSEKSIGVYIDSESDSVTDEIFSVLIQAQIYGKDEVQEYHSVIMPYLRSNLTGAVVDMTQRISITADIYPMEIQGSTAFAFYQVVFNSELDDCEYDD